MDYAAFDQLCRSRRSIRRWQDKPVPDDLLAQAIETAIWAPNGGNRQPYHFYVIKNKEVIEQIARAVEGKGELMATWPESRSQGLAIERYQRFATFFRQAPVLIAACAGLYASPADQLLASRQHDPEAASMLAGRQLGSSRLQSVAAAVTQMLLAFTALGLGAVWMTGPLQAKADIEAILHVPPEMDFVALIPVGYPAEEPAPPPRRGAPEIATFIM